MERVHTLLNKLQKQLQENATAQEMLPTVQILQAELMNHLDKKSAGPSSDKVSVLLPLIFNLPENNPATDNDKSTMITPEEKVVEVLQVDEEEMENELQEIKKNANAFTAHGRPDLQYDPIEDVPTLSHQDPVEKKELMNQLNFEYPESLNDRLKEVKIELSQSLTSAPIKDLKKAIGVNDRFLFINELFRGDEAMYERSIKTIQNFSIYAEAEFWIRRELKVKIGWHDSHPVVKQFDQLIKRRFA